MARKNKIIKILTLLEKVCIKEGYQRLSDGPLVDTVKSMFKELVPKRANNLRVTLSEYGFDNAFGIDVYWDSDSFCGLGNFGKGFGIRTSTRGGKIFDLAINKKGEFSSMDECNFSIVSKN